MARMQKASNGQMAAAPSTLVLGLLAALFCGTLSVEARGLIQTSSNATSAANSTCLSLAASFYNACWPIVLAHNKAAKQAFMALYPNSTDNLAYRDMLPYLDVNVAMWDEIPTPECCAASRTFFGAAFQAKCANGTDPSIKAQVASYTKTEIDAVGAFFGGICDFVPAPSNWTNVVRKIATGVPGNVTGGRRRLLGSCSQGGYYNPPSPNFFCASGYGHCDSVDGGGSCIYGSGLCPDLFGSGKCYCYQLDCNCFPGDARVERADGSRVAMRDLRVGDRVKTAAPRGGFAFEEVYMFGHRDAAAVKEFVGIALRTLPERNGAERNASAELKLRLSADHFVPVVKEGQAPVWANRVQTRAKDVRPGQVAFADVGTGEAPVPCLVTSVRTERDVGLFNPYTMNGLIVVDGVVASAHSAWVLDGLYDALGFAHYLPASYQVLFAPIRSLYRLVGPAAFARALDAAGVEAWGSVVGSTVSSINPSDFVVKAAMPLVLLTLVYKRYVSK